MATWTIAPDFSSPGTTKYRILQARFGDGYQQRVADGINTRVQSWALRFSARTAAELSAIVTFLTARAGTESFDWTAPDGTGGKWVCTSWQTVPDTAAANTVTATFEQVFE